MIPILYDAKDTELTSNGIGALSDCTSCIVKESRNGEYELTAKYPVGGIHYEDLKLTNIIKAEPAPEKPAQPFLIYKISKPLSGVVTVYARHWSYKLNYIPVSPFTGLSAFDAMQSLKAAAAEECDFDFRTDITTVRACSISEPMSARSALGGTTGSILYTYHGEYEWDFKQVYLHSARGKRCSSAIRYGKNLTDLKQEESIAETVTGIMPYYKDQETGQVLTLPEKVIYAENADLYPFKRSVAHDFSNSFDGMPTVDQLRERAEKYIEDNDIGVPKVSLDVKFIESQNDEVISNPFTSIEWHNSGFNKSGITNGSLKTWIRNRYPMYIDRDAVLSVKPGYEMRVLMYKDNGFTAENLVSITNVGSDPAEIEAGYYLGFEIRKIGTTVQTDFSHKEGLIYTPSQPQPEKIYLCDTVDVIFEKLGVRATAKVISVEYNTLTERYEKIQLGDEVSNMSSTLMSLREEVDEVVKAIAPGNYIVQEAIKSATDLLNNALGGIITVKKDENGKGTELLIMDTADTETATKVWRWNINGLGYSGNGYKGPYALAMTMDGAINASKGTIGGWQLRDDALFSEVTTATGDKYRVFVQGFNQSLGTATWIYSIQKYNPELDDWNSVMRIQGDGTVFTLGNIGTSGKVVAEAGMESWADVKLLPPAKLTDGVSMRWHKMYRFPIQNWPATAGQKVVFDYDFAAYGFPDTFTFNHAIAQFTHASAGWDFYGNVSCQVMDEGRKVRVIFCVNKTGNYNLDVYCYV